MLIDIGYDMELALSAPTALIYLLRVSSRRVTSLVTWATSGYHRCVIRWSSAPGSRFIWAASGTPSTHAHNTPRIGRIVMVMGRDGGDVPITMTFGANTLTRFEVTTDEVN